MLNPDIKKLIDKQEINRYALVTGVAKRARQIASDAEDKDMILQDKPISMALQELIDDKYYIILPQ
ncbi:MAG: DNA-directed RNA polymerase subunit omega [Clostridia bacterium]|nr:DNA-directed RNA polymerase subunit omega [Clostridia bacterium]